jgi:hypothetical protein
MRFSELVQILEQHEFRLIKEKLTVRSFWERFSTIDL